MKIERMSDTFRDIELYTQRKVLILYILWQKKRTYFFLLISNWYQYARVCKCKSVSMRIHEYVRACVRMLRWTLPVGRRGTFKDGKAEGSKVGRCENGNVALIVVSIIRRKTYATIQEKIFHVLAKQQQTNDKRVCR